MKPGDIRMLPNESTGIITQQTSATSEMHQSAYKDWMADIHKY